MKKIAKITMIFILCFNLLAIPAFARELVVGGQVIGLELMDHTVTVAAFDGELGSIAKDAGLQVGVYFFSQALTPEEAEEEAYFVLEHLEPYKDFITMPVVFDWEHVSNANARTADMRDPDMLTDCTLAFLQTIEAAGYRTMVYFNRTQSWKYLNLEELKDYEFWLENGFLKEAQKKLEEEDDDDETPDRNLCRVPC